MTRRQRDAAPDGAADKLAPAVLRPGPAATAAQVADYLQRHPDFFVDRPELLDVLIPPDANRGDGVVNLQHFLLERLRQQLAEAERAHDHLVAVGRANMVVQTRIHRAVLMLLCAQSFESLIETVTTDLAVMLDLDAVALGVEQSTEELPPVRLGGLIQLEAGAVDRLIGRGRSVSLAEQPTEARLLLFGAACELVTSQALIRLSISRMTPPALLALGSRRAEQFHEGQRTELLTFLARALERCIRAWLNLPS